MVFEEPSSGGRKREEDVCGTMVEKRLHRTGKKVILLALSFLAEEGKRRGKRKWGGSFLEVW